MNLQNTTVLPNLKEPVIWVGLNLLQLRGKRIEVDSTVERSVLGVYS